MLARFAALIVVTGALIQCSQRPPTPDLALTQTEAAHERLQASDGGRLLLKAIDAHGGLEAWHAAPTSAHWWEYSNVGMGFRFKSYLVADNRTRQVYHELLSLGAPDDPQPASGRFAWDGQRAWIAPAELEQPNPRFWAATGYYFESIPFILADPGLHYEALPPEELDGVTYDMVKVSYDEGVGDSPGDTYTLYLHPGTGMVDAIRYTVSFGQTKAEAAARQARETLLYYRNYVTVAGLTVATYFRGYHFADGERGDFKSEAWAGDISFRQPFEATNLSLPANGRVQPLSW
jgi:hypothetical protein